MHLHFTVHASLETPLNAQQFSMQSVTPPCRMLTHRPAGLDSAAWPNWTWYEFLTQRGGQSVPDAGGKMFARAAVRNVSGESET